jgi:predicted metal-dependent hydrolase
MAAEIPAARTKPFLHQLQVWSTSLYFIRGNAAHQRAFSRWFKEFAKLLVICSRRISVRVEQVAAENRERNEANAKIVVACPDFAGAGGSDCRAE